MTNLANPVKFMRNMGALKNIWRIEEFQFDKMNIEGPILAVDALAHRLDGAANIFYKMLKLVRKSQGQLYRLYSTHYEVKHDLKLKEFSLGDGAEKAVLQYKDISPATIELEHTIVPESLQGKGLGKLLADAAFEYALDRKLKVKVTCGFVQKYLEKYPKTEFNEILLQ